MHCSAKGEPVPALKWLLPAGIHVKPSQYLGRRLFVFPNGTLFVKNVLPSDGGRYTFLFVKPFMMCFFLYVCSVQVCGRHVYV